MESKLLCEPPTKNLSGPWELNIEHNFSGAPCALPLTSSPCPTQPVLLAPSCPHQAKPLSAAWGARHKPRVKP